MIQTGFWYWKSFYNITYVQLYVLTIVAGYIGTLFCMLLSMLISAKTHTAVVAVTIPFVILFLPLFLSNFRFLEAILENSRVALDQNEYIKRYEALAKKYDTVKGEYDKAAGEIEHKKAQRELFKGFIRTLENTRSVIKEFEAGLWSSLVKEVVVETDGRLRFVFKNGAEITE